jgi:hypothetical protein
MILIAENLPHSIGHLRCQTESIFLGCGSVNTAHR